MFILSILTFKWNKILWWTTGTMYSKSLESFLQHAINSFCFMAQPLKWKRLNVNNIFILEKCKNSWTHPSLLFWRSLAPYKSSGKSMELMGPNCTTSTQLCKVSYTACDKQHIKNKLHSGWDTLPPRAQRSFSGDNCWWWAWRNSPFPNFSFRQEEMHIAGYGCRLLGATQLTL